MKLHLHRMTIDQRDYCIFTLRAGLPVSWSTNHYHGTWHILGNMRSAKVLAHLMWGLSYQRSDRCFIFIDRPYIQVNPFDAERSDPILIGLQGPSRKLLRRLKKPMGRPRGNVRWRTFGLMNFSWPAGRDQWRVHRSSSLQVARDGGVIALYGSRQALRLESASIERLKTEPTAKGGRNMDYVFVGDSSRRGDAEVQIFHDYLRRRRWAQQARAQVLAQCDMPQDPATIRSRIYALDL